MAIIKKYESFDWTQISKEFDEIDKTIGSSLSEPAAHAIESYQLNELQNFNKLFISMKNINLVYYGNRVENQSVKRKIVIIDKRRNINSLFYEGLGDINY